MHVRTSLAICWSNSAALNGLFPASYDTSLLYYTIFIRQRSVLFLLRKHTILFLFRKRTVSFRRLDAVEYWCGQGIETGIEIRRRFGLRVPTA